MQITRYSSITENQFLGCLSAFMDTLRGELNGAAMFLRKLEDKGKGSAFAFEMQLDKHRYGAMIALDRWNEFLRAFRDHSDFPKYREVFAEGPARVKAAEGLLERANDLIDASPSYSGQVIAACMMSFQSLLGAFDQERQAAEQALSLGPMLPEEFKEYRRVFLGDLAAR